ncbi:MAG: DUF2442 domain-containing protein [Bacteroidetes bacterium]|nr:DUF2442 domain-containing protein [Bacteroidota bacterium]
MNSKVLGKNTSTVEVTNISNNGIWLYTGKEKLFLPFTEFLWFKDVPVHKILNVEEVYPGHFYWRDLDIDLTDEIIKQPDRFPLKAK